MPVRLRKVNTMPVPWRSGSADRKGLGAALNRGEFVLHYQTIHELRTGTPTSAEALVRWRRPQRGLVMPGDFIPLAEANGQIVALGAWIVRTSLRQLREWVGSHPCAGWTMSVNVSGRQIEDPSIVRYLVREIESAGVDPSRLILEVTETYRIHDLVRTADRLARLRDYGIRIALDDFGSGYLNVKHLQMFPADRVKVDSSLTSSIDGDTRGRSVLRALIDVSRELGMEVVVEGIETAAQRRLACDVGATHGQGWYFSKAEPASALERPEPGSGGTRLASA